MGQVEHKTTTLVECPMGLEELARIRFASGAMELGTCLKNVQVAFILRGSVTDIPELLGDLVKKGLLNVIF